MPGDDGAVQQEARGFSVKETIVRQTFSISDNEKCERNVNLKKNHLLHEVRSLQYRVNNLSIQKRKPSFVCFKVTQRNFFGLTLLDKKKSSPLSYSIWRYLGVHRGQDYQSNGPLSRDC